MIKPADVGQSRLTIDESNLTTYNVNNTAIPDSRYQHPASTMNITAT